ncbi:UNVERIFIED_CONTAM: hypothetical protein K2H54_060099 [Gekko kuhli]
MYKRAPVLKDAPVVCSIDGGCVFPPLEYQNDPAGLGILGKESPVPAVGHMTSQTLRRDLAVLKIKHVCWCNWSIYVESFIFIPKQCFILQYFVLLCTNNVDL